MNKTETPLIQTIGSLLFLLRRHINLFMIVTALGTLATAFIAYNRDPSYSAQALIMLEPTENRIVNLEAVVAGLSTDSSMIETQIKLLTSPNYLMHLADRLHRVGQVINSDAPITNGWAKLATAVWRNLGSSIAPISAQEQKAPSNSEAEQALLYERQITRLDDGLKVEQQGRSLVLSISYTSKNKAEAAQVANTLANLYIEDQLNEKLNGTKRATEWLESRLADLKREVREADQAVEQYRNEHRLFEAKTQPGLQINSQQVGDLTTMLVQTRAARSEKETRLRYIRNLQSKGEGLESITEVLQSPYLSTLWQQKSSLQQQAADLRSEFGDKHPKIQTLVAQNREITVKISDELDRLVDNMSNELSVLLAREKSINEDIDTLLRKASVSSQAEIELHQLERQEEASKKFYEDFLNRYKETKEQQAIVQPNAKVIAQAPIPTSPSSISPNLLTLAGFVGFSAMSIALSWLVEYFDNGVRSGKEIESEFDLPCFGLVPLLRTARSTSERRPHRYMLAKPVSAYTESIRSVYTALRMSSSNVEPKVIQITSSVPGEGKTVFAVSFATLLAIDGHRTALIDLDLRHPSVQREIAVPDGAALTDYIMGDLSYDSLTHHDRESGLDVIALRHSALNPAAILRSQRLRDLVTRLRAKYDCVIIDGPPVLGVSDSKMIGEIADATIFVLRWGKTSFDVASLT